MSTPTPTTPAADPGRVTTRRDGRILVITIDRPAKYNGFTPEMGLQLAAAYTELEQDEQLWAGVVCAQGPHFTAGLDLPRWAPIMKAGGSLFPQSQIDPFEVGGLRRSKPMLVAVKGICFTLGIELMLAADIVVAADDCRFSQLEVKRGIMPTGGATVRITERAGIGNAMLLMLTGDEFGAADALRMGMVQKVVAAGHEFDEAMAIARRMVKQLEIIHYAVSLGHLRSLIYWIGTDDIEQSTFRHGPEAASRFRDYMGDGVFRLSVGIEDGDDLWADLVRCF